MRRLFLLAVCCWLSSIGFAQQVLIVRKGDVQHLLEVVEQANQLNAAKDAERLYVLIPDGFYDLGERVLTCITGNNIALIGQSMQGTVIQNCPDKKNEGISKTAVFQNRGTGNVFQDLTLKNALDYYASGAAGRAVTLHDKGTQTVCNRVCLLSYQDTYYSDNEECQHYFQDSEIHGTVDFICGAGDVWFERCRIVTEKRNADGQGRDVIAAPRTSKTPWGYIFNHCTIENVFSDFVYARGWNGTPHCIWLNTILLSPEKLIPTRFDHRGMRTVQNDFREYGTKDTSGNNITPKTNVVNFELRDKEGNITDQNIVETILSPIEVKGYSVRKVFADWQPQKVLRNTERQARELMKYLQ